MFKSLLQYTQKKDVVVEGLSQIEKEKGCSTERKLFFKKKEKRINDKEKHMTLEFTYFQKNLLGVRLSRHKLECI